MTKPLEGSILNSFADSGIHGTSQVSKPVMIYNLTAYGALHAAVDAACAGVLFACSRELAISWFAFLAVLYNVLAFGLQPLLGFAVDLLRRPALASASGCLLTAGGVLLYRYPLAAILLAGAGNALFHVGGGIISLNLRPGKAALPGIYVAPGALGLMVGTLVGRSGHFTPWVFGLLLCVGAAAIMIVKAPVINYNTKSGKNSNYFELIILLLLLSIAFRSLIGLVLDFPWKRDISLLVVLTLGVVLGKALGGIIGDRLGWTRTAVGGLLVSAPLIAFGMDYPWLAIPGVLLFNMTMPVTLTAAANMLPGRAGFAFGLTALALVAGAMPTFTGIRYMLYNKWVILVMIPVSALILYKGLRMYFADGLQEIKEGEVHEKNQQLGG